MFSVFFYRYWSCDSGPGTLFVHVINVDILDDEGGSQSFLILNRKYFDAICVGKRVFLSNFVNSLYLIFCLLRSFLIFLFLVCLRSFGGI